MNVLADEKNYRIGGRYTWQEGRLCLAFSASYVEFAFCGTKVTAQIASDDFAEDETLKAWVAVFIDGADVPARRFPLAKGLHKYEIFNSETPVAAAVRIMKYSENAFGMVAIADIEVEDGRLLPCPKAADRLIGFIGDSITCGYGIEGVLDKDVFTTTQENPWNAYACLTARAMGTDFELVSWSGNGIISHYVEETVNEPRLEKPLMPQLYPYADLELETRLGKTADFTLWNPAKRPDIIVIHLGTNDCSYAREIPERNEMYRKGYIDFVHTLRKTDPHTPIVCMLGIMDQRLNKTLGETVEELRAEGDADIYFLDTPLQDERDGMGTDSHPSAVTHEKLAKRLCAFIEENVCAK